MQAATLGPGEGNLIAASFSFVLFPLLVFIFMLEL